MRKGSGMCALGALMESTSGVLHSSDEPNGFATAAQARPDRAVTGAPTNVLVLADVRLLREGIAEFLGAQPEIRVVGAHRLLDLDGALLRGRVDVAVVHVARAEELEGLRRVLSGIPATRLVLVGVPDVECALDVCISQGVAGFLTVDGSLEELEDVVLAVSRDELRCTPAAAGLLLRMARRVDGGQDAKRLLTRRERQIVAMIGKRSNREIARELHLALPTVKNHVHNIMRKLGARSRAEAATSAHGRPVVPWLR